MADVEATMESFRTWLTAQSCSRTTIRERLTIVRAFGKYLQVDPLTATSFEVLAYIGRQDLAPWSRMTYYNHLASWFAYLHVNGLRHENPMAGLPSPKTPLAFPRPLSDLEEEQLMGAARPMMRTWLTLGLYAGLRAMEIAKITGQDVNERTLFVIGKGGREDLLPTHPRVWEEAQRYGRGLWFPTKGRDGHYQAESLSHVTSVFFTSLGIDGAIHRCRHTYATKLLRAGVNIRVVQTLMRHSSVATTQRYTAVDEHERRDAVMLLRGAA